MRFYRNRKGTVLLISIIFLAVFIVWSVSISSMAGTNIQLSHNQRQANQARASAESGLDILRYWTERVSMPGTIAAVDRFDVIAASLQDDLAANQIYNIYTSYDGSTITIPFVALNIVPGQSFSADIRQLDDTTLQLDVTGSSGQITRTIRTQFNLISVKNPIFDYGLATKGPLQFSGNPILKGVNSNDEADIYIESQNDNVALLVGGNTNFDGDISIGNENASANFQGDISIAGDFGQTAIDNHVFTGVGQTEFPVPDTGHFQQYATGNIIDASTDTSDSMTLTNVTIEAGANPSFDGNVEINGILFIESPNIVTFIGNVEVKGIIIGDGDVENPGTNQITFLGNFQSGTFPNEGEFDVMRSEVGSTLLAPGFAASLQGNFSSMGGVMAVSGAHFSGNVNALVKGTIVNYSDSPTTVDGNATLNFDRSGMVEVPAGFEPEIILQYQSNSYSEVVL